MAEKSRTQLVEELETLHRRLAQRDRAMAKHKEAGESAQRQLAELQSVLGEYRKEVRQARKISASLAQNGQRAEQLAKAHADAFDLFCAATSDLVFRLNQEGRVIFLSPSCARLLGFTGNELQGRRCWDLLEGKTQEQLRGLLQTVLDGDRPSHEVWHWKRKGAPALAMEVYCRAVPHSQTDEKEIVGLARPAAADAPRTAPENSDAWMASLGHELKQPLTAIANYAHACISLVQAGTMEPADLLHALEQTAQQAERATELIQRLRHLGAPEELRRSEVQINDLVRETLHLLEEDIRAGAVRIDLQLGDDLPSLQLDWIQIGQVLINLTRNAIDALAAKPPEERLINIATRSTDTEVEVSVRDTGEGLSLEMVNRLFEPFHTTKPQGMGLGLALSRAIVQAHGGRLWVKPNAAQGTTFFFTIPRHHEQQ